MQHRKNKGKNRLRQPPTPCCRSVLRTEIPRYRAAFLSAGSLRCVTGRNLHSNYTLKLAKCKETYAFFSTFTQKLYFLFMISHKNHRRNSAKAAARSAPELTSAGAETLFHNLFPFAQPIVENTSGETGAPFSTVWKVHCRPVRCGFPQSCAVGFPLCGVFRYGGECVPDRKTGGASG